MWKWAGIVFGCGMLLIVFEWLMARRKKGGVTWTDQQRMLGIFWISVALAALAAGVAWIAD
jgi:hypothetical protein